MKGKIAIVTGAANGIGRACALRLAREGAVLAMVDIEPDGLAALETEIAADGGKASGFVADMSDQAAIVGAFARISETVGPAGILVNNVGRGAREHAAAFEDFDRDVWNYLVDLNLKAALACAQLVIKGMKSAGEGRIINIASDSAFYGSMIGTAYAAAKGGVISFTRSLARELGQFGVTVNAVAPGYIRTRAMDEMPPAVVERAIKDTILGHLGAPEDIAHAVSFFAGAESSFITGQTLLVNGGRWFN